MGNRGMADIIFRHVSSCPVTLDSHVGSKPLVCMSLTFCIDTINEKLHLVGCNDAVRKKVVVFGENGSVYLDRNLSLVAIPTIVVMKKKPIMITPDDD